MDQGSQFISRTFISPLKDHGVCIGIDGCGGWRDNVLIERLWRSFKYQRVDCLATSTRERFA